MLLQNFEFGSNTNLLNLQATIMMILLLKVIIIRFHFIATSQCFSTSDYISNAFIR